MKRLLGGFNSHSSSSSSNKKKPSSNNQLVESNKQQEIKENVTSKVIGLGIELDGNNNKNNKRPNNISRRSKHVQFDSINNIKQEEEIYHSTNNLNNQNSIQSITKPVINGGNASNGLHGSSSAPLSSSTNTTTTTKYNETLGPPFLPIINLNNLIDSNSTSTIDGALLDTSIGLGRPSSNSNNNSPLSFSPTPDSNQQFNNNFPSVQGKGKMSPYPWSESHPSLARVSERDSTQINGKLFHFIFLNHKILRQLD